MSSLGLDKLITDGDAALREGAVPYIVLGAGIDARLNVNMNSPYNMVSVIAPRRGEFSVSSPESVNQLEIVPGGVLSLDEQINNKYAFVPISFARNIFERDSAVSSLELSLSARAEEKEVVDRLKTILGPVLDIKNQQQQQEALYKMFRSEKWASYAILTFVLLIAAFNVVGSLTMLVLEKKKDIRTFSSLGARDSTIRRIFIYEGMMITMIGSLAGLTIGACLVVAQEHYGFIKMAGAIVDSYPVILQSADLILVLATSVCLGLFSSIYPALRSTSTE
jgi:ABC-type lipoprotein release transport system permease subunit